MKQIPQPTAKGLTNAGQDGETIVTMNTEVSSQLYFKFQDVKGYQ